MAKSPHENETKLKAKDAGRKTDNNKESDAPHDGGWRETIESLAMAVILALLFKGYVAEAFVIPTGSMAPTLQGRHRDIDCPQCGFRYQTTASDEVEQSSGFLNNNHVVSGTCPVCRFTHPYNPDKDSNESSFSGDRIIVSKFAYEIADPRRWDVIVFKYPGGATQNYIKRLVGLPGETLQIAGGNIYTRGAGQSDFHIARKPPHKLTAMLQIVDDSDHIPPVLTKLGWPTRWREITADNSPQAAWKTADGGASFSCAEVPTGTAWLRYRHFAPSYDDWAAITVDGKLPADAHAWDGQLITDFYAYNTSTYLLARAAASMPPRGTYEFRFTENVDLSDLPDRMRSRDDARELYYDPDMPGPGLPSAERSAGAHWVDDLAVECVAELQDSQGSLAIDLVRAGTHYRCTIDVATGKATLTRTNAAGNALPFCDELGEDHASAANPTAQTSVKGAGSYRLRLTNCDHQVLLFVNGYAVTFDMPTCYQSDRIVQPAWTKQDGLDLEPAGIGVSGLRAKVSHMRIFRDKYYIAIDSHNTSNSTDYTHNYQDGYAQREQPLLQEVFASPDTWISSGLFDAMNRRQVEFTLNGDEFFPMGDNSPSSSDGRYWYKNDYLTRDLLIGKALFIYWPHSWNRPVPFQPNLQRMRPIH
ncbi:signal peptidase I [Anatilimnocola floriformis]|uniref:signal peptidase I n=1 Tax=Anatilimnocola floriformis TaxID=2948575 RepID=UPI0020C46DF9|nr:signal peptidase I [Anatilimnocola floriformis]